MHKITTFTGQARHGWERMTPAFGMSRQQEMPPSSQSFRRPHGPPVPVTPSQALDPTTNVSFNVPFSSDLAGPEPTDILHSTPAAFQRWTFPEGTPEGTPVYRLPVHAENLDSLRKLCRKISDSSNGRIETTVTSTEPKKMESLHRKAQNLVTNVCISGDSDVVHKMKAKIYKETPIALVR